MTKIGLTSSFRKEIGGENELEIRREVELILHRYNYFAPFNVRAPMLGGSISKHLATDGDRPRGRFLRSPS